MAYVLSEKAAKEMSATLVVRLSGEIGSDKA